MADIKYEIKKTVGALSENNKGWSKELNLISWNDREPKYDIRDWAPEHEKMGKGVTLSFLMAGLLMMLEKMNGGAEEIHWRIYNY